MEAKKKEKLSSEMNDPSIMKYSKVFFKKYGKTILAYSLRLYFMPLPYIFFTAEKFLFNLHSLKHNAAALVLGSWIIYILCE